MAVSKDLMTKFAPEINYLSTMITLQLNTIRRTKLTTIVLKLKQCNTISHQSKANKEECGKAAFKNYIALYSRQQNYSCTCDSTCDFSLVWLKTFIISCL